MSLVSNLGTLITDIGTQFKNVKSAITGSGTSLSLTGLTTTTKTSLIAAINELDADIASLSGGGGATSLDDLTDVVITTPATGHILRHNGTNFVNALGTTYFDAAGAAASAQAASQPLDSDLTSIAALTTTTYGRALLTLANSAALTAAVDSASTTVSGIVELATNAEALTGTDTARAVTPAALQAKIDALVASAPGTLDTLNELAAALGNDANYAATITTALAGKQPIDSDLTSIAALNGAANKMLYATGANTWALADLTAAGRAILDDADAAAQRTTLDVYSKTEIGDPTTDFAAAFAAALT
jgi:hypothetical protein